MSDFYPVLTKNECGDYYWTFKDNVLSVYKNDAINDMVFPSVTNDDQFAMFMLGMSMYCHSDHYVQDCFPSLSPDEREYLITGATPEMWDRFFNSMEAEKDDES